MNISEFYETLGVDSEKVRARFMDNDELLLRFLKKFLEDPSYEEAKKASEEKDFELLEQAAHTLKGVSGNLGLDPLYEASAAVVQDIRTGKPEDAVADYNKVDQVYEKTVELIRGL